MKTSESKKIVPISSGHLTEAQYGELLDGSANKAGRALTPAEEHLAACGQCTAELANLRKALILFREASMAYAESQLRRIPAVKLPARPVVSRALRPMYFAAAAALLLASFVPLQMLRQHPQKTAPQAAGVNSASSIEHYATESNEALLEDVDRAASGSIPESMQALADPMGVNDTSARKSNQRKD